ncbi:carbohydrate esterase family 9 protein [Armillaria solidipes]|uniref:Carbohydrate esterase family 9 protein n=1 Tax=Armillaria solidipes TaxID=1076256 RepID=A0A2H3C7F4_9AGAR|nr:carbohydrate esterase family 9 protein [Armillaria solidipes]
MSEKRQGSANRSWISFSSLHLWAFCIATAALRLFVSNVDFFASPDSHDPLFWTADQQEGILSLCASLDSVPGVMEPGFITRDVSDRYEPGTNATLIKNATIFTGEISDGEGVVLARSDILLDMGIVKAIGNLSLNYGNSNISVIHANGAWVTPGLIDLQSHLGVMSIPLTEGASDENSKKGPIVPWLRTIDALNTHDDGFKLAVAGGVTSVKVIPGNMNAIAGEAFMIKTRPTSKRSPSSMVIELPDIWNATKLEDKHVPWRYLHQGCGEDLAVYNLTRMDTMWALRSAYTEALQHKNLQDGFCAKAQAGLWASLPTEFPQSVKWELLTKVLRGKVKVSVHCNEAVDLDGMVRLSNEFQFPISVFHQASEAWLVMSVLNETWGGTPAISLYATNHRSKRESFRGSEFAPRTLAEANISVAMQPAMNSRDLIFEAQQAYHFGLPAHLALASVTSTPAIIAGLSHRIGTLGEGRDADVVMWDSHPLRVGATPTMVWIDGTLQVPSSASKPSMIIANPERQKMPTTPNWDKERLTASKWDGLPPLRNRKEDRKIVFYNVKEVWTRDSNGDLEEIFPSPTDPDMNGRGRVVVERGNLICVGGNDMCLASEYDAVDYINLHGGSISPGLHAYGTSLGLEEIPSEPSTGDGHSVHNPFMDDIPQILHDVGGVTRAVDALSFGTRNAKVAYRSGVTAATSFLAGPQGAHTRVILGLSTTFRTGSAHSMQYGAVIQDVTALHIAIAPTLGVGVSDQVAALRHLLFGWESTETETGLWFKRAAEGEVPLVIDVNSADIMATLLLLKGEVEDRIGSRMRVVFSGATEAHLLAPEIGNSGVGVILHSLKPYPTTWDGRRILAGSPITNDTALSTLLKYRVTVGIGMKGPHMAQIMRFDLASIAFQAQNSMGRLEVLALASRNLDVLLGVREIDRDVVVYDGGSSFDLSGKAIAVISPRRQGVDMFGA